MITQTLVRNYHALKPVVNNLKCALLDALVNAVLSVYGNLFKSTAIIGGCHCHVFVELIRKLPYVRQIRFRTGSIIS